MRAYHNNQHTGIFTCRFCTRKFAESRHAMPLVQRFCPTCRDLYEAAAESVRRGAEVIVVERSDHWPHAAVFPANLPRREERAA